MRNVAMERAQNEVTDLLKREIGLMREILSSMCKEEAALVEKDPKALQAVMTEREGPLRRLMAVRDARNHKILDLVRLLAHNDNKNSADLASLLEAKGMESCEVMVLRDQIIALVDKMNEQNTTNDRLMQHSQHVWKELMSGSLQGQDLIAPLMEKRKAILLAVINPEL